ncbi:MAG TPA: amidohydrolase family protein [Candidatus Udaeobacter sp.]|jgi:imidazolonepropionase-like amidohydrolase
MMKKKGTFLTPTLMASEWIIGRIDNYPPALQAKAKAATAARSDMFRNAVKIGLKISFGTDAAVFPHGQNAKEFKLMVDLGLNPIDALKSATANDAELLGIAQKSARWRKGNWPT